MSATNIQWITIAVLGFGAVFAFFVLVFVFEATVHALRYRDQYAGGGGGFRMPSFGGRQGGGISPGEPSSSPRSVRQRDPQVNRALAREAARIAADERIRSGEVRLRPVPNDEQEPAPADAQDQAEPIELVADIPEEEAVTDDLPPVDLPAADLPAIEEPETQIQPLIAERDAIEPGSAGLTGELAANQAEADGEPTTDEEEAVQPPPLAAEPLVLTAKHEVTLDKSVSQPKAGRVTMRATKGPLIAAESTFRRHSGEPRSDKDGSPPSAPKALKSTEVRSPQIGSSQPEGTAQSATGLPEKRLSELRQAEVARTAPPKQPEEANPESPAATEALAEKTEKPVENRIELRKPELPTAPAPQMAESIVSTPETPVQAPPTAPTAPVQTASAPPAAHAEPDPVPEPPRTSKVAQPSQPESEVMADTTRQLKSLRDAEEFGGGPQTGEASCPLYLRYRSASGIVFDRIVQAVTLEDSDGEWIMRAFCHRSKAMRRIRVSNVVAAFDLRTRDVSVSDKVSDFLRERVPMRGSSGSGKSSEGGAPPAAAE
ncbi:MAG: hypothetical protein AAFW76_00545 [Pseudomonadota bacterium]